MKKNNTIACCIIPFTMLTLSANNSIARDCYGPEVMYEEGPISECQEKAGPIKLSKNYFAVDHSEMQAEGPVNRTKPASQHNSGRLVVRTSSSPDITNMWAEGIPYSTGKEGLEYTRSKEKSIKPRLSAGQL